MLLDFVKQFYAGTPFIPRELMLQEEIEDIEILEKWLSSKKEAVFISGYPRKGQRRSW